MHAGVRVTSIEGTKELTVGFEEGGNRQQIVVDKVIVSIGRAPRTVGVGLEAIGVALDDHGYVEVDGEMRTNVPGVYAVGDVVPTPQLAHVGFAEAIVAIKSILGEPVKPIEYDKVPWGIYCHPEVAYAGLTEEQARERGHDVVTSVHRFVGNSRALIIGEPDGIVKIVSERDGPVLGVHIVGPWATELIAEGYLAVNWEATPEEIGGAGARAPDAERAVRRIGARAHRSLAARVTARQRSWSHEERVRHSTRRSQAANDRRKQDAVDVTMPQLGETVTEGTITRWLKQPGDPIKADEPLFEVSTDKVDSEVPAPTSGVLAEIRIAEGETAAVGTVLAVISDAGAASPAAAARRGRCRGRGGRRCSRDRDVTAASGRASADARRARAAAPPPPAAPAPCPRRHRCRSPRPRRRPRSPSPRRPSRPARRAARLRRRPHLPRPRARRRHRSVPTRPSRTSS